MRILLVDDEKNILRTLTVTLQAWGHDVSACSSLREAASALNSKVFDLLLTDFKLAQESGIELVRQAAHRPHPPVTVVMTAFASFENAVIAIKEGAYDYFPKPFSNTQLEHLLRRVQEVVELKRENDRLKALACRSDYFEGQTSAAMVRLEEFVRKVAPTDASVLLIGESGTGKTELARLIHAASPRASKAFGVVNCASLTESLLESELFGHAKGAFTGAIQDHIGKLEQANGGTVLIDEIGELPLKGQVKLLRFLQEKVVERVGSNKPVLLDVRIIAATNRNLEDAVRDGSFREDLYYRLNILECNLVPLRFRKDDVPVLITRFLHQLGRKELPPPVSELLLKYGWPGNIRELRNVLERIVLLAQGREIHASDLPDAVRLGRDTRSPRGLGTTTEAKTLEELEREHITRILEMESNQERAAEILGITTVTLWRKRKQYGLP